MPGWGNAPNDYTLLRPISPSEEIALLRPVDNFSKKIFTPGLANKGAGVAGLHVSMYSWRVVN
jgi:hypothetical protein